MREKTSYNSHEQLEKDGEPFQSKPDGSLRS